MKEGATAPFLCQQLLQMQQQTIDSAVAQRLLQVFPLNVIPPRQQWFWPLSANAATHVWTAQSASTSPPAILHPHVKRTKLPDPGIIQPSIQPVLTGVLSCLGSDHPLAHFR
jgi:hypothetical protein